MSMTPAEAAKFRQKKKRSDLSDTEKEKEPPAKKLQIEVEPESELVIPEGFVNVEYTSNGSKKPEPKINIKLEIPKKQDTPNKLERNKAFFCIDHYNGDNNFNPFSIVIADTEKKAKELLKNKIDEVYKNRNSGKESVDGAFSLVRIDMFVKNARIISCFPKKIFIKKDKTPVILETNQLKLFSCTDHYSKHPYPGISFVVAKDEAEAKVILTELLSENFGNNIPQKTMTLKEIPLSTQSAFILYEGNVGGNF